MSTKTTFKRVALIAVASLGLGVLTSVSANAAVTGVTNTYGDITRTAIGTWTVPLTTVITGTGLTTTNTISAAEDTTTDLTSTNVGAATCTGSATSQTCTATMTVVAAAVTPAGINAAKAALIIVSSGGADATSAAVTGGSVATGSFIAGTYASGSTTSAALQTVNGQATLTFVQGTADTTYTVTSSGVGTILSATGSTTASVNIGLNPSSGVFWTPATNIQSLAVKTTSAVAGTQTLTFQPVGAGGAPGTAVTATITWGSAPAVSTQYSLLTLNAGAGTTATGASADTKATVVATTAATKQFTIQAVLKDQNDVAINGLTLGASISGPGTIGIATTTASSATSAGRSLTVALTGTNLGHVTVFGDGSAGVATITVTATTSAGVSTIIGTKSVTFVGAPSKVTVTQNLYVAKAGTRLGAVPTTTLGAATSVATTAAFTAKVMDTAGIAVAAGSTVKMTSSDSTVITGGSCAELTVDGDATATVTPTPGVFECSVSGAGSAVSGKSATITFSVLNATTGLYDIVAAPLTFKVGGSIATVAVTTDKATYSPGAAINMIATAKDSAGNAAFDGQNPYITATPTANMTVGGALPGTTAEIVNGAHKTTGASASLFAPASTGDLTVSGTLANSVAAGVPFSATVKVVSSVDAQIASLLSKINALAKLIAKIQKKLGVK